MTDITFFLTTAEIDGIKVGISLNEYTLQQGLIEDKDKHYYDNDNPEYGFSYFEQGIEFIFIQNILNVISIDASGTELILLSKYNVNCYTNLEKMLLFLEILDIEWKFLEKHTFNQQLVIKTLAGVQLSFTYDKGHGFMLSKIQSYLD